LSTVNLFRGVYSQFVYGLYSQFFTGELVNLFTGVYSQFVYWSVQSIFYR